MYGPVIEPTLMGTNGYLTAHPLYLELGSTALSREKCYRSFFATEMEEKPVHEIRTAASFSTPLGNTMFIEQIEKATVNKASQAKRGRPHKSKAWCE